MGTRALTIIKDTDSKTLVNLYRQFDGYQDYHGSELKHFLSDLTMVNGFSDRNAPIANGMGCLAAQLIAHLKTEVGLHYIHPTYDTENYVDYVYTIYPTTSADESTISIKVESYGETLFEGLITDYPAKD
jgi:hypothetical protein